MTFNHWMMILFGGVAVALFVPLVRRSLGVSGVDTATAKERIKRGATVIDVRTPAEYASGHYESARNIPLQELQHRLAEVGDKQKALVVYCTSGRRSAQADKILTAAGFTDVTNAGGLTNLTQ